MEEGESYPLRPACHVAPTGLKLLVASLNKIINIIEL